MRQISKISSGFAALALIAAGTSVGAQDAANRMSRDSGFITKAAQGGMAEVELGKLAVANGTNPKVKEFGQKMVDDHSKAGDELKAIAVQKGVTIPDTMDAKSQALKDRLSQLSGAEFDKAYISDMVRDHHEDIAEFSKEATGGQDPDVKAFASKTLPTLKDHLKMAEETSKSLSKMSK